MPSGKKVQLTTGAPLTPMPSTSICLKRVAGGCILLLFGGHP